MKIMT